MSFSVAAVVVAAGRGVRAGGTIPKQYRVLNGEPLIRASLSLFAGHTEIQAVVPVIQAGDATIFQAAVEGVAVLPPAFGGATRQASVRAGLEALAASPPDLVLVHDAARPFASPALVSRAIAAAAASGAAIPCLPVTDTIKSVAADGSVERTLDRASLRSVQTPQAFAYPALLAAHRKAHEAGRDDFTDDAALAEWAGLRIATFPGEAGNVKITTDEDFLNAEARHLAGLSDVRTGTGYDVHAFGAGDHVMLGGVRIAHDKGLSGHSDADVVLHAAVDAILGALADGDIGHHFPPSDPQWRGAASHLFLRFAMERVRARGAALAHLDMTIVCEAPRIGPHRDAIRRSVAEIAAVSLDRVAVKATTSEGLGFTGRREGIAAMATATVRLPWTG